MARLDDYGLRGLCGIPGKKIKDSESKIRFVRTQKALEDWREGDNKNNLAEFYEWLFEGTNPADPKEPAEKPPKE